MPIYEGNVEVVNAGRIVSAVDGTLIYQVTFGMIVKPHAGFPAPPGSKEVAANTMTLYFKSGKEPPYTIGSKWKLKISENGNVSVTKRK